MKANRRRLVLMLVLVAVALALPTPCQSATAEEIKKEIRRIDTEVSRIGHGGLTDRPGNRRDEERTGPVRRLAQSHTVSLVRSKGVCDTVLGSDDDTWGGFLLFGF